MNEQTYRSEPKFSNIAASLADLNKWSIQLVEKKQDIHQQLNDIDQKLKDIEDAKSVLTKLFDSDPPQDSPTKFTKFLATQIQAYDTWDEYREAGRDIPEVCPASPGELMQIMAERPIPIGTNTTESWAIKKERNFASLSLMANRVPDAEFRLLDFANLMSAVGMFDGLGHRYKTTLIRHMQSVPEEWNDLGKGRWKFLGSPAEKAISEAPKAIPEKSDYNGEDVATDLTQPPADSIPEAAVAE